MIRYEPVCISNPSSDLVISKYVTIDGCLYLTRRLLPLLSLALANCPIVFTLHLQIRTYHQKTRGAIMTIS